jgi:redox-sensitive bicupin YhaK (pirin superfamily)
MLAPGATLRLDVDAGHEHGILVDTGLLLVEGDEVKEGELAYVAPGRARLEVTAAEEARLLVLGGPPFGESIVMWWNFVGRDHDEIVGYRGEWQEQITRDGVVVADGREVADGRFGVVADQPLPPIPAPAMPNARLKQRR